MPKHALNQCSFLKTRDVFFYIAQTWYKNESLLLASSSFIGSALQQHLICFVYLDNNVLPIFNIQLLFFRHYFLVQFKELSARMNQFNDFNYIINSIL